MQGGVNMMESIVIDKLPETKVEHRRGKKLSSGFSPQDEIQMNMRSLSY